MITTAELVKKVRFLVNEAEGDYDVSLITDDKRSLDYTIMELLPQAVALVQKNSARGYVNVKALSSSDRQFVSSSDGCPSILLPDDFVRLVSVQLNSWKKPCFYISSSDSLDAVCALNGNLFAGLYRPICVEGVTEEGKRTVKPFPYNSDDVLIHFVYEAQYNINEGLVQCDEHLADAVAYACASLLYNVFEKHDASKSFMSFAMALCTGNENVKR